MVETTNGDVVVAATSEPATAKDLNAALLKEKNEAKKRAKSESLEQLAAEINAAMDAAATLARETFAKQLVHYHAAGVRLTKAKAKVAHGNWLPWLKKNCPKISERQQQRYMALAKYDAASDLTKAWKELLGHEPKTPKTPKATPAPEIPHYKLTFKDNEQVNAFELLKEQVRIDYARRYPERAEFDVTAFVRASLEEYLAKLTEQVLSPAPEVARG
jgi:hypothetical protein